MKFKKGMLFVFFTGVIISLALFIYACSKSESDDNGGNGGDSMELNKESVCEETGNLLELSEVSSFTGLGGLVMPVKQALAKTNPTLFKKMFPADSAAATDCPVITAEPELPPSGIIPDPWTITVDYGAGCDPTGTGEIVSGSIILVLSNFQLTLNSISGDYTLTANHLTSGGTELNGSASGSLEITINATTGAMSGSASVDFDNFTDGSNNLNGSITVDFTLDENLLGTVTAALDDFTAGGDVYNGTITITLTSDTSYTIDINLSSTSGDIDVTLAITISEDGNITTINTASPGTYKDLTFEIDNVVIDSTAACQSEPVSGSVTWSDGAGNSVTVTFDGNCDGADVSMNDEPATSCESD